MDLINAGPKVIFGNKITVHDIQMKPRAGPGSLDFSYLFPLKSEKSAASKEGNTSIFCMDIDPVLAPVLKVPHGVERLLQADFE